MNYNQIPPPHVLIENFDGANNKDSIKKLDSFLTDNFQNKETQSQIISLRIINAFFKSKDYLVNRLMKKYDYTNGIERIILKNITNLNISEVFHLLIKVSALYGGIESNLYKRGKHFHPLQYLHIENLKSINHINHYSESNDYETIIKLLIDIFSNTNSLTYSIKHLVIIGDDYFSSIKLQRIMAMQIIEIGLQR